MNTIIFRTIVPALAAIMVVFSVFVLLRGHNEPGGGFIGGLIAASAVAMYGIAVGVKDTRAALRVDPIAISAFGVLLAGFAGLLSLGYEVPFMTGLWATLTIDNAEITVSTPMMFDIGVYFVVLGTISAIALALEETEGDQ